MSMKSFFIILSLQTLLHHFVGGIPLYKYVLPQMVWFFNRFGHKLGIAFGDFSQKRVWVLHSSLELEVLSFKRTLLFHHYR